ncbi:MAG: hypothetical protein IT341_09850 [Chloroflexi bacterium]|nr:hypothetical protein [Chloroflexota bacterium]
MQQTELRGYLPALRRWWPTLLASTIMASLVGVALSMALPPRYEARAQLLVGPVNASQDAQNAAGNLARTYAELVLSETFLSGAVEQLGLTDTTEKLREDRVQVSGSTQTRFVVILAQQNDPVRAADLANFLADQLVVAANKGGEDTLGGEVTIIDRAEPPTETSGPPLTILVLAAGLAGAIGAVLLAVASEYFGDRVRDGEELAYLAGGALLGTVDLDPRSPKREQKRRIILRHVASAILLTGEDQRRTALLAPLEGEDGPELATLLTAAVTEFGRSVTLVGDGSRFDRSILASIGPRVRLADTGANPMLDPAVARATVDRAGQGSDVVLVCPPALGQSPAALIWAGATDTTIVAAPLTGQTRASVRYATEAIRAASGSIGGIVALKPARSRRRGQVSKEAARPLSSTTSGRS